MEALERQLESLRVREERGLEAFWALQKPWNALVETLGNVPFYRHEFLSLWLNHFAPNARLRILQAWEGDTLVAALPLLEEQSTLCGISVTQLSSPTNSHSCRFDLLARSPQMAAEAFMQQLSEDASWELLRLVDVPEHGAGWKMLEWAQKQLWPHGTWLSQQSPFLELPGNIEEFEMQRSSRKRSDLRRRRRRLLEMGRVDWQHLPQATPAQLNEAFLLEAHGWKGEKGTAINQVKSTLGFYSDITRWAEEEGMLALSFLRLDEKPLAFDLGLLSGGRYFSLKVGYDEKVAQVSPGQLLTEETVFHCIRQRVREFDFLGDDNASKREWTKTLRPHHWLYVFRDNAKGRMLRKAKFDFVPLARRMLSFREKDA